MLIKTKVLNKNSPQGKKIFLKFSNRIFDFGPSAAAYQGGNIASLLLSPQAPTKMDATMIFNNLLLNRNRQFHDISMPPQMNTLNAPPQMFKSMIMQNQMNSSMNTINNMSPLMNLLANVPPQRGPLLNNPMGPPPMQMPMNNNPMMNPLPPPPQMMMNNNPPSPIMNNGPPIQMNPILPPNMPINRQSNNKSFSEFLKDISNDNSFYGPGPNIRNPNEGFDNPIPPPRLPPRSPDNPLLAMMTRDISNNNRGPSPPPFVPIQPSDNSFYGNTGGGGMFGPPMM